MSLESFGVLNLNNGFGSRRFGKFDYRDALGVFFVFATFLPLVTFLINFLYGNFSGDFLEEKYRDGTDEIYQVLVLLLSTILSGVLIFLLVKYEMHVSDFQGVLNISGFTKTSLSSISLSFGLGFLIVLFQGGVLFQLFPPSQKMEVDSLILLSRRSSISIWLMLLIIVVIVAPLVEEFVFRGLIFLGMKNSFGDFAGAMIASILFLVVHFQIFLKGYWVSIISISAMSFLAGILRVKFDSLLPAIFGHAGYNFAAIIFSRL